MSRLIRAQDELRQASNHLFYEIWMFQTLAQGVTIGIAGEGPINNALLESFTIHVRALIGFFYSESPRNDHIVAEDFFQNPNDWMNKRPLKTELLEIAKKRADREVAHLTYARIDITPEEKQWEFLKIFNDLQIPIGVLLDNVSIDLLGSNWDEIKRRQTGFNL